MAETPTASDTSVLLLVTDQQRVDTIGCYGNPVCETPALDRLAAAGTRFDAAFTPTAICAPARASLVTGVHPFRHRVLANAELGIGYITELDDTYPSFAYALQEEGYHVGHIGKWHVGTERGPEEFGFEGEHYPGWGNPVTHPAYLAWLEQRGLPSRRIRQEIRVASPNGKQAHLLAGVLEQPVGATFEAFLAEQAIERLHTYAASRHEHQQPFFLAVHWFGPHLPYCIPPDYFDRYDPGMVELPRSIVETFTDKPRVQANYSAYWAFDSLPLETWRRLLAVYYGYVTLIDEQINRVLETVRQLGMWDSTAIIFAADHGEFTGSHRLNSKAPAMYDDIYRIPMIARIPGAPAGRVDTDFASLLDLAPTILDIAGVKVPAHMDGRSLTPLIWGHQPLGWRDEIVAEFHGLHFPYPQRMIRTERYKLIVNPADTNELYDLATDPDELHNRYDHPELRDVRERLMGRLYQELRQRGDSFCQWMSAMYEVGTAASQD